MISMQRFSSTRTAASPDAPAPIRRRSALPAGLLVMALSGVVPAPAPAATGQALDRPVPRLDHIIVIVMENKQYDLVRVAPYTASLITAGSSFSQSYAVTHPSQPNYIAMWAGSTLGVINDNCPPAGAPYSVENLGHACEAAGLTWRAYSENLPSAGSPVCTADGTLYTRKHDPWTNFTNLDHLNERPFSDLALDIAAGTLPNLAYVIPNNCNNTHDTGCTIAIGDAWLQSHVPDMLAAIGPRGLLVLTWDEDDNRALNHILTVFVGDSVRRDYIATRRINHYTVLRTLCDALGLQPFGFAAAESSITDVWGDVTTATLVSLESVRAEPGLVRLAWSVGDPSVTEAAIQRRTSAGAWTTIGSARVDGTRRLAYEDARVEPGARYGYRLAVGPAGSERYLGEAWVEVPRKAMLALAGAWCNPASNAVVVGFALPDARPARIDLLDVSGRRLASREVGSFGAGSHSIELRGDARLRSGVYVARLTQGAHSLTAKALFVE